MNLYNETKYIMKKYNISAAKRLGQNFLIDDEVVTNIVEAANITKEDTIIEIGPGLGTLTKELLERAGRVVCIELDERMVEILKDRFSQYTNFELINDDVLKVDLKTIIKNNVGADDPVCPNTIQNKLKNTKIVANLPYYITTPIIMKLLEDKLNIQSITVMIQKEVASRLVAEAGGNDSGAITYGIRYYTNPTRVVEVSREAFLPAPEVDSTVIKLDILEKPPVEVESEELLFKIIKASFMQRRKTLLNCLANSNILKNKEEIENMLSKLGFDLRIRGEKLSLNDFAKISNYVQNIDK